MYILTLWDNIELSVLPFVDVFLFWQVLIFFFLEATYLDTYALEDQILELKVWLKEKEKTTWG